MNLLGSFYFLVESVTHRQFILKVDLQHIISFPTRSSTLNSQTIMIYSTSHIWNRETPTAHTAYTGSQPAFIYPTSNRKWLSLLYCLLQSWLVCTYNLVFRICNCRRCLFPLFHFPYSLFIKQKSPCFHPTLHMKSLRLSFKTSLHLCSLMNTTQMKRISLLNLIKKRIVFELCTYFLAFVFECWNSLFYYCTNVKQYFSILLRNLASILWWKLKSP